MREIKSAVDFIKFLEVIKKKEKKLNGVRTRFIRILGVEVTN